MPFSSPRNCIFKRNVVVIKDYLWYKLKVFHPSFLRTLWKLFFQRLAEIYTWLEFEKRKKIKCELRFFIFQQNLSRKNWNFWTNIFSVGIRDIKIYSWNFLIHTRCSTACQMRIRVHGIDWLSLFMKNDVCDILLNPLCQKWWALQNTTVVEIFNKMSHLAILYFQNLPRFCHSKLRYQKSWFGENCILKIGYLKNNF